MVENKELSSAKGLRLDLVSRLCKSKTMKVLKIVPVECLHSSLSMMRTDYLKLHSVGDFSKRPI